MQNMRSKRRKVGGGLQAGTFDNGDSQGIGTLLGYLVGQQKQTQAPENYAISKQALGKQALPGASFTEGGITNPLNQKFTNDESRSIAGVDAFNRDFTTIMNYQKLPDFQEKYKKATFRLGSENKGHIGELPTYINDPDANILNNAISAIESRLVYLRSGAQINEGEFKRLRKNVPGFFDLSRNDPTNKAINNKLNTLRYELNAIKGRLIEGGNYNPEIWEESSRNVRTIDVPTRVKVKATGQIGTLEKGDELDYDIYEEL